MVIEKLSTKDKEVASVPVPYTLPQLCLVGYFFIFCTTGKVLRGGRVWYVRNKKEISGTRLPWVTIKDTEFEKNPRSYWPA